MCMFDMRHVAGGKWQVYYRIETSKEYIVNLWVWHVAGGKYIMMLAFWYTKENIFNV